MALRCCFRSFRLSSQYSTMPLQKVTMKIVSPVVIAPTYTKKEA